MRDAPTLTVGMICRYTDPDGNQFDAIIDALDGTEAFIVYRPPTRIALLIHNWVATSSLSVPR